MPARIVCLSPYSKEQVEGLFAGSHQVDVVTVPGPSAPEAVLAACVDAELIEIILAACDRHHITAGIHRAGPETALGWREAGFRMLNVDSDAVFVRGGAAGVLGALRGTKREVARTGY